MAEQTKRKESFSVSRGTLIDKLLQFWRAAVVRNNIMYGEKICDLGCGMSGEFLGSIQDRIGSGLGVDIEVGCRDNPRLRLIKADLNGIIPISSDTFDKVVSLAVVEHLEKYDIYLKEAFRILRPGGKMIITTPHPRGKIILSALSFLKLIDEREIDDHKNYFDAKTLKKVLSDAGFSRIEARTFQLGFNNLIIAQK